MSKPVDPISSQSSEHWYQRAAEIMVRTGVGLFAATQELDLGILNRECEEIVRSKEFQVALRGERNKFYKELANDPARSRTTAVGQLLFAIDKMLDAGQNDKAANAILQLAKIEGWTSDQTAANLFFDLSGKDLSLLRDKFKAQQPKKTSALN